MGFDETIIHCGAPALCGIKPASLFSMNEKIFYSGREKINEWQPYFSKQKKYFVSLKKNDGRILFFVYDANLLTEILADSSNAQYLRSKNYPVDRGFHAVLAELLHRLSADGLFPHEVGLFLGYPLEDVIGFESRQAAGSVYSGFWKVYGDVESARRTMNRYKSCSEFCMKWLNSGLTVPLAAEKYTLHTEVVS
ncbi:MAG: DUF3793 family protein [Treponema sp.]|nr:DUF3793 family protein [Treponema sp.]